MNWWQADIEEFHEACGIPVANKITPLDEARTNLRRSLIKEESKELRKALDSGDLPEIIDGMIDTIVVVIGTAVEMGVDLDPFWNEVQATNMAKTGGPVRGDGKVLKPEGWQPPRIGEILVSIMDEEKERASAR